LKYLSLFLIAALALIALASLDRGAPLAPLEAQNATLQNPIARVEPAQSVVGVGDTFTITVMIDNASNLGGFEFGMSFDPSVVHVDGGVQREFLASTGRFTKALPLTSSLGIDNVAGELSFGAFSYGDVSGPEGAGALALITLTAQGEGESPLNLRSVQVVDTASPPTSQVVTAEDGTVVVGALTTATSTPTATSTTTVTATPTPTSTGAATPTPTATATGTPPTPTSTATATTAPEPAIVVYPTEAPRGETFTFTGSHFTPDGEIEEWFADPDGVGHRFDPPSFYANSSGGFSRQHYWPSFWPVGTYSYIAKDVAKGSETSVEFEMTEPLAQTPTSTPTVTVTATATPTTTPTATPYRLYLPLVLRDW
jgi:hypothetical protein